MEKIHLEKAKFVLKILLFCLVAGFYVLYLYNAILNGRTGIDYLTFMDIGKRWLAGQTVYIVNSYYPLPYVGLFAAFASLPQWLSILIWFGIPVIIAVWIAGPLMLGFAPLAAHFLGGQTAIVGMIGVYGYRRYRNAFLGGLMLAVSTLKPQLAIIPIIFAGYDWLREYRERRRVSRSLIGFLLFSILLWVPSFFVYPGWLGDWLKNPRQLSNRAMAGLVPRSLLQVLPVSWLYFALLLIIAAVILFAIRKHWSFETALLWYFVISPLVHDYDLVTLIPILKTQRMKILAVLLSLPTWIVLFFAYDVDPAWFSVTIIPVGLLLGDIVFSTAFQRNWARTLPFRSAQR